MQMVNGDKKAVNSVNINITRQLDSGNVNYFPLGRRRQAYKENASNRPCRKNSGGMPVRSLAVPAMRSGLHHDALRIATGMAIPALQPLLKAPD